MDTVVLKCLAKMIPDVADLVLAKQRITKIAPEWLYKETTNPDEKKTSIIVFNHLNTGCSVRLGGAEGNRCRIQVSLPRLLYPTNSICLSAQEADSILLKLKEILDQILDFDLPTLKLDRLDFAFQFECDLHAILNSYKHARSPLIHNNAASYFKIRSIKEGIGLQWVGSNFSFTFYDKAQEMLGKRKTSKSLVTGKVLRIEVSFKNPETISRFFTQRILQIYVIPPYFIIWRVVRAILLSLTTDFVHSINEYSEANLIAILESINLTLPNGQSALNWRNKGRCSKRAQEFTKKVHSIMLKIDTGSGGSITDLSRILPANVPPPSTDIHLDGQIKTHRLYFGSYDHAPTLSDVELRPNTSREPLEDFS